MGSKYLVLTLFLIGQKFLDWSTLDPCFSSDIHQNLTGTADCKFGWGEMVNFLFVCHYHLFRQPNDLSVVPLGFALGHSRTNLQEKGQP